MIKLGFEDVQESFKIVENPNFKDLFVFRSKKYIIFFNEAFEFLLYEIDIFDPLAFIFG